MGSLRFELRFPTFSFPGFFGVYKDLSFEKKGVCPEAGVLPS